MNVEKKDDLVLVTNYHWTRSCQNAPLYSLDTCETPSLSMTGWFWCWKEENIMYKTLCILDKYYVIYVCCYECTIIRYINLIYSDKKCVHTLFYQRTYYLLTQYLLDRTSILILYHSVALFDLQNSLPNNSPTSRNFLWGVLFLPQTIYPLGLGLHSLVRRRQCLVDMVSQRSKFPECALNPIWGQGHMYFLSRCNNRFHKPRTTKIFLICFNFFNRR